MNQERNELIRYRWERALETLEDARILAQSERWNARVNRLYYACFYAVSALLLQQDLSSAKHAGVRSLFSQSFVRMGIVPKEVARIFNDLFERRQESDYVDLMRFKKDQVVPWLQQATAFIDFLLGLRQEGQQ